MPHNPSDIVPPEIAEYQNLMLKQASDAVRDIREYPLFNKVRDIREYPLFNKEAGPSRAEVADALEAILDLVAPHWRNP